MAGGADESCPITLIFFKLMVSPKFLQTWENLLMSICNSCCVRDATAISVSQILSVHIPIDLPGFS